MPYCIVLFKIKINDEIKIVTHYHDKTGLQFVKYGVRPIVRIMEEAWKTKDSTMILMDAVEMSPSVIQVGDSHQNIFGLKILNDPFPIADIDLLRVKKMRVAICNGDNAVWAWNKGIKPKFKKEDSET